MKRPVSVIKPMYSAWATVCEGASPSPFMRSQMISAVQEAPSTT